jgi:type I restriction enzyme S subunit
MGCSEWQRVRLGDVIEFNPKETIKKKQVVKKISMEKLGVFTRKITGYEEAEFTSGTKFRNGDTLLARITPCLENGKTAQVDILDDGEVAFGSTEFIVLRECKGKTINKYIYYLSISPKFRDIAIKCMNGSSGRQRVQKDVLEDTEILLPPLKEQEKIAKILSSLDDKIELNNDMNKTLEEMAKTIFKRWFVEFEFPNEEGKPYKSSGGEMVESELGLIPLGWEVGNFRHYTEKVLGGDWGKDSEQSNYNKKVYCLRGADIPEVRIGNKGALPTRYILEKNHKNKKLSAGDIVIEISGGSPTQSTGRITYINDLMLSKFNEDIVCTNFCRAVTLKSREYMEYFYFYWKFLYDNDVFFQYENGTTGIKNLDINSFLDKYEIVVPSEKIVLLFGRTVASLMDKIQFNGNENINISNIRDTLLPKLLSGSIKINS